MSILGDLSRFDQDALIELYVLDATKLSAGTFYFYSGTNELKEDITWQGQKYMALPVSITGFEFDGTKFPRPKAQLSNVNGLFSDIVTSYDDLIGCKLIRKRTTARYLDAVNFTEGNPTANPSEHLPDDVYFIVQKTNENRLTIEFELGSALDLAGVYLPRWQIIATVCQHQYRDQMCGYAGGACADEHDAPTTDINKDKCSHKVSGCKKRYGESGELSFGGFPGSALVDI